MPKDRLQQRPSFVAVKMWQQGVALPLEVAVTAQVGDPGRAMVDASIRQQRYQFRRGLFRRLGLESRGEFADVVQGNQDSQCPTRRRPITLERAFQRPSFVRPGVKKLKKHGRDIKPMPGDRVKWARNGHTGRRPRIRLRLRLAPETPEIDMAKL
jgi:hypothetical protein